MRYVLMVIQLLWWYAMPPKPLPLFHLDHFHLSAFQLEKQSFLLIYTTVLLFPSAFSIKLKIFSGWFMMMMTNFVRKKSGPLPEPRQKPSQVRVAMESQVKSAAPRPKQLFFFSFSFHSFHTVKQAVAGVLLCCSFVLLFGLFCVCGEMWRIV